jgi:signal transduction histidine kinase
MEVNKTYIQFLLQLINNEENIDIEKNQKELIVNLYITLLSLSNIEFSEEIDLKEKNEISDFLRKLNNLKVKIQLKRKYFFQLRAPLLPRPPRLV